MTAGESKTISARVPVEVVEKIDSVRDFFINPDGSRTTRSRVLRGILQYFLPLLDPAILRRVDQVSDGKSQAETILTALEAGLAALEQKPEPKGKKAK